MTHSHPDHIGAANRIKEESSCIVYAPKTEISWIENIDTQFKERPIPNFTNYYQNHYISFVAAVSSDRLQLVKLYLEGYSEARFKIPGAKRIRESCKNYFWLALDI